ncbi:beta-ketoacyl-ACP synthase II [Nakamurella sp. YIM 132087]|uniref:Beta-ketoacyl-ACP synthase II n=1 Tax=Nakamurella alba TaxID=2665158 RepID=A0A7K1FK19_9ACTN|nr:beta-ketoacyl-[acyl-carrier-protein] synthase family protein [Nakamurella alba]MTD13593.1 beta-ketoacyl-ACP synthase II [Nakamurella alba]
MSASDQDVVVTGIGATTPIGGTAPETWQAMLAGTIGVKANTASWVKEFDLPVAIHAPLAVEPTEILPRVEARRLDRCQQVALVAAREAWADAGSPEVDPERLGTVVGTGIGGALTLLGQDDLLETEGLRKVSVMTIPMLMPNGPAAAIGLWSKSRGGVHAPVSACASGAEGMAWAYTMIKAGELDIAIAGGAEACIHQLPVAGFSQMRAMSTRNDDPETASRPFDTGRDGFVLGEGAGIMVLERRDHAVARGAKIYGTLAGIGMSNDAHHITAPEPDGEGGSRAIAKAIRSAGLTKADIGHVNAHATSTPVGDVAESKTILRAIGNHPVVTATKSMTGHMLGGSGAVEAIATVLAVRDGIVPGTRNVIDLDPKIEIDVATENREVALTAAINDSFGFGGHNVALIFTA